MDEMPNSQEYVDQDSRQAVTMDISTRLAFERTRVSYERTMMAWIRTATSLISFGFAIYKFFQIELARNGQVNRLIGPREFAFLMVAAGLFSLIMGLWENRQNMRSLRERCAGLPRSKTTVLAASISALGILAFVAMIFRQ